MTSLYEALIFAKNLHGDQRRIGGKPVMTHLLGTVANLVAHGWSDEKVLCAAVLHDTVEDCELTFTELGLHFGSEISSLVHEVSEQQDSPSSPKYFPLSTPAGAAIKMADRLNNLQDMESCSLAFRAKQVLKTFKLMDDHHVLFAMKENALLREALMAENVKQFNLLTPVRISQPKR